MKRNLTQKIIIILNPEQLKIVRMEMTLLLKSATKKAKSLHLSLLPPLFPDFTIATPVQWFN